MPPANRRSCGYPSCEYTTFEGLQTKDEVSDDLKIHIQVAHELPQRERDNALRELELN